MYPFDLELLITLLCNSKFWCDRLTDINLDRVFPDWNFMGSGGGAHPIGTIDNHWNYDVVGFERWRLIVFCLKFIAQGETLQLPYELLPLWYPDRPVPIWKVHPDGQISIRGPLPPLHDLQLTLEPFQLNPKLGICISNRAKFLLIEERIAAPSEFPLSL